MQRNYLALAVGCNVIQFCIYQHTLQVNVNLHAKLQLLEKLFDNCQTQLELADKDLVYDIQKQQDKYRERPKDWNTAVSVPRIFSINSMQFSNDLNYIEHASINGCSCSKTDILNPEAQEYME